MTPAPRACATGGRSRATNPGRYRPSSGFPSAKTSPSCVGASAIAAQSSIIDGNQTWKRGSRRDERHETGCCEAEEERGAPTHAALVPVTRLRATRVSPAPVAGATLAGDAWRAGHPISAPRRGRRHWRRSAVVVLCVAFARRSRGRPWQPPSARVLALDDRRDGGARRPRPTRSPSRARRPRHSGGSARRSTARVGSRSSSGTGSTGTSAAPTGSSAGYYLYPAIAVAQPSTPTR